MPHLVADRRLRAVRDDELVGDAPCSPKTRSTSALIALRRQRRAVEHERAVRRSRCAASRARRRAPPRTRAARAANRRSRSRFFRRRRGRRDRGRPEARSRPRAAGRRARAGRSPARWRSRARAPAGARVDLEHRSADSSPSSRSWSMPSASSGITSRVRSASPTRCASSELTTTTRRPSCSA